MGPGARCAGGGWLARRSCGKVGVCAALRCAVVALPGARMHHSAPGRRPRLGSGAHSAQGCCRPAPHSQRCRPAGGPQPTGLADDLADIAARLRHALRRLRAPLLAQLGQLVRDGAAWRGRKSRGGRLAAGGGRGRRKAAGGPGGGPAARRISAVWRWTAGCPLAAGCTRARLSPPGGGGGLLVAWAPAHPHPNAHHTRGKRGGSALGPPRVRRRRRTPRNRNGAHARRSPRPAGKSARALRSGRVSFSFVEPASVNSPELMRSSRSACCSRSGESGVPARASGPRRLLLVQVAFAARKGTCRGGAGWAARQGPAGLCSCVLASIVAAAGR
jgi:hypothetical protein